MSLLNGHLEFHFFSFLDNRPCLGLLLDCKGLVLPLCALIRAFLSFFFFQFNLLKFHIQFNNLIIFCQVNEIKPFELLL
jgi:hypothetical protein